MQVSARWCRPRCARLTCYDLSASLLSWYAGCNLSFRKAVLYRILQWNCHPGKNICTKGRTAITQALWARAPWCSRNLLIIPRCATKLTRHNVYSIAAALDDLAARVAELAGNIFRDNKKQRIVPRHLQLAMVATKSKYFVANHAFQIERTVVISQSSVVRRVAHMEGRNMRLPSPTACKA